MRVRLTFEITRGRKSSDSSGEEETVWVPDRESEAISSIERAPDYDYEPSEFDRARSGSVPRTKQRIGFRA